MIALVVVVLNEGVDLVFQMPRQVIILQQDAVLQGLMPTLDLALGLGVVGRSSHMVHFPVFQPFSQISGDVRRAIITEQTRLVRDIDGVAAGRFQGQLQCCRYILDPHIGAQLPLHAHILFVGQCCRGLPPNSPKGGSTGASSILSSISRPPLIASSPKPTRDPNHLHGPQIQTKLSPL